MKRLVLPPADAFNYPYRGYASSQSNNYYKELKLNKEQWKKLRVKLLQRQDFKCAYCKLDLHKRRMNVEHVIPLKRGGSNHSSNLVAACAKCNEAKGNRVLRKGETRSLHNNLDSLKKQAVKSRRSYFKSKQALEYDFIDRIRWIINEDV